MAVGGKSSRQRSSRLTPQEEDIIKVSFEAFSEPSFLPGEEGKSFITTDNLKSAFVEIGASGDIRDIELLIDDIDENGDGKIDFQEWYGIMKRKFLGEDDDSAYMHVFRILDEDGDGIISAVELRSLLMREGGAPLSEQEADELITFADEQSDGLVDYKSFLKWLLHAGQSDQ